MPPADLAADDLGAQPVIFVVARDIKLPKSADLEWLSRMGWVMNQDGCGFRQTLKRQFEAAHLPFNVAVEALESFDDELADARLDRRHLPRREPARDERAEGSVLRRVLHDQGRVVGEADRLQFAVDHGQSRRRGEGGWVRRRGEDVRVPREYPVVVGVPHVS